MRTKSIVKIIIINNTFSPNNNRKKRKKEKSPVLELRGKNLQRGGRSSFGWGRLGWGRLKVNPSTQQSA